MAPRSRHSHASLMVVLSILLFAGIGVFIAQSVAQKKSLDAASHAAEQPLKPRFSPTPSPKPSPLPSGKPEILGAYTENTAVINANQSRRDYSLSASQSDSLNNSILFAISGIVLILIIGFLFSSKALLM